MGVRFLGQDVFSFTNYLDFIQSETEKLRKSHPDWSVSKWANDMGFMNPTALHMIIKGKRRPGSKAIPKLCRFFQFSEQEEKYFRYLLKRDLSVKDPEVAQYIDSKLKVMIQDKSMLSLEEAEFRLIAEWYHYAIQQMLCIKSLPADPAEIQKHLFYDVSLDQVSAAIENLIRLKIIERSGNQLQILQRAVRTSHDIPSEALRLHAEQMIENAKKSIRKVQLQERSVQGRTLVIKKDQIEAAKKMIQEFSNQFGVEIDSDMGDQVYQLNIQFFPLTEQL